MRRPSPILLRKYAFLECVTLRDWPSAHTANFLFA